MEQGVRTVRYDPDLGLEAYHFSGVIQIFPGHFHEYYTLGFLERGLQHTICRGIDCLSEAGDLLLFAPGDVHSCRPVDGTQPGLRRSQCTGRDDGPVCPGDHGGGVPAPVPGTSGAPE